MPVLDPQISPDGLAIAGGAVIIALLDSILGEGVLSRDEIQSLLKTAMIGVGARAQSREGAEAIKVINSLWDHFTQR